jgi:hypothetical protein
VLGPLLLHFRQGGGANDFTGAIEKHDHSVRRVKQIYPSGCHSTDSPYGPIGRFINSVRRGRRVFPWAEVNIARRSRTQKDKCNANWIIRD